MLKRLSVFAGALLLTGMLAQSASASLTYDFRLTKSPSGATATTIAGVGTANQCTIYIYAKVVGTDATKTQWIGTAETNVLAHQVGGGGATGFDWKGVTPSGGLNIAFAINTGGVNIASGFKANGWSSGQIIDLNSDSLMDVGTNSADTAQDAKHPAMRAAYGNVGNLGPAGLQLAAGGWDVTGAGVPLASTTGSFYLGFAVWIPTGALGGGSTVVAPDQTGVATIGQWVEDGTPVDTNGDGTQWDVNGGIQRTNGQAGATILVGTSVTIASVPEPAALGLLALGALLALRRRSA